MTETQFHTLPGGTRLAYRYNPGSGPALVFLPGYMSDMAGGKATAVFDWATAQGRECLLLDYSGCGESDGRFEHGTLDRWRDEVVALIDAHCAGAVLLVGSSMGGWLMLLAALAIPERVHALVGIAAAPDFTDWSYSPAEKVAFETDQSLIRNLSSTYDDEPMPMSRAFWESGQKNLLLDTQIPLSCPVRLLQGQQDAEVPWQQALKLAQALRSADVQVTLVKDGDHRLSRDSDLALLLQVLAALG